MKRIRLDRCAVQFQPPRNPRLPLLCREQLHAQKASYSTTLTPVPRRELQERRWRPQTQWQCQRRHAASKRKSSSAAAALQVEDVNEQLISTPVRREEVRNSNNKPLNAPPHQRALKSAKLAALHARLSLPARLPLQTLARCLIDASVDARSIYNNSSLAIIGQDLLGYYTAEWLMCHYPRLPMPVLFAAQYGYVGNKTLDAIRSEWGVEVVAAPGPEVDPGLLQLRRSVAGNSMAAGEQTLLKDMPSLSRLGTRAQLNRLGYRTSNKIVQNDEFGEVHGELATTSFEPFPGAPVAKSSERESTEINAGYPLEGIEAGQEPGASSSSIEPSSPATGPEMPTTVEDASASFVRALAGALYLHAGVSAVKNFHKDHILSRHLPLHTLFNFTHPTRDVSRLCAREGFEPPVARLISETGRLSRSPVFVVGVFSGDDKLGEAAGSSLNEGRVRAAAAALRSWYLYSPPSDQIMMPSQAERASVSTGEIKQWKPQMIDIGEVIT